VVLASASPRREELLKLLLKEFETLSCPVPEDRRNQESPQEMAQRLALAKAQAVLSLRPESTVIGADTVVVCAGDLFGKPSSREDARRMLRCLSGRSHHVITGVCVLQGSRSLIDFAQTVVVFSPLSDPEIACCLETGEPLDKAGAYAIQGIASRFIERIEGCFFNVVGLPVSLLYHMLKEVGLKFDG
jgi:septum formation protein